jgi:divalent metal cation (Fe/Co/Zn/Cd) transporter
MEYLSTGWMGVEVLGSVVAGLVAGSVALIAFGGDSLVELLSSVIVARHLKQDMGGSLILGRRTAQFSSVLLLSLLPTIGVGAGYSYLAGLRPAGSPLGIAIAIGAVVIMPYLWFQKRKVGRETRCLPLQIDAVESATCFLMSVALLGGLLAEILLGLWWADYLATGVILVFVAKEARESYGKTTEAME